MVNNLPQAFTQRYEIVEIIGNSEGHRSTALVVPKTGGCIEKTSAGQRCADKYIAKIYPPESSPSLTALVKEQLIGQADRINLFDGLPRLLEWFADECGMVVLWEFIDGTPLVSPGGETMKLQKNEVFRLGSDLLNVISQLQQLGLVHGDIKPSNLVRREDGRFVLIDLDVVIPANQTVGNSVWLCGTPVLWCRERFRAKLTYRTDIWALAVTVLCCLSGLSLEQIANYQSNDFQWNLKALKKAFSDLSPFYPWLRRALWVDKRPFDSVAQAQEFWPTIGNNPSTSWLRRIATPKVPRILSKRGPSDKAPVVMLMSRCGPTLGRFLLLFGFIWWARSRDGELICKRGPDAEMLTLLGVCFVMALGMTLSGAPWPLIVTFTPIFSWFGVHFGLLLGRLLYLYSCLVLVAVWRFFDWLING